MTSLTASIDIFDFNKTNRTKGWFVVDDGVMGGLSAGNLELSKEGHAKFDGTVSIENNGGFSSVRCRLNKIEVENRTKIRLTIKGDKKNYQLRIKDNSQNYYSYVSSFSTNGKWQKVEIELKDMYPTFRGRSVNKPNFDQKYIEDIAFLISNKKAESFELLIDKIELI